MSTSVKIPASSPDALNQVHELLGEWRCAGRRYINEADSKALLSTIGLPVPRRGSSALSAVKFCSDAAMHKSELGLVQLRITPNDIEAATRTVLHNAQATGLLDGKVLVEEMVTDTLLEWFVGCRNDRTFGPVIALGVGGIYAELFGDPVIRLAPLDEEASLAAIKSHRAFPIIDGARGRQKANHLQFARVLSNVSKFFAAAHHLIDEVDLNPVLVRPGSSADSIVIADASLVLSSDDNATPCCS